MALTNGVYRGRKLSLTINSVEYNLDATSITLQSEDLDGDALTYGAYNANGGKQWYFNITGIQDLATGTLWRYVWDNAGLTAVPFKFKMYGNGSASSAQPFFTGTLTVAEKPDLSGDPNSVFTFTVRFDVDGTPTMQTTGS